MPKQRQEKGVERRSDEGRSGDPDYEQRETREESSEQREQTTHPHYLLSGLATVNYSGSCFVRVADQAVLLPAGWRFIAASFRSGFSFAPALHDASGA